MTGSQGFMSLEDIRILSMIKKESPEKYQQILQDYGEVTADIARATMKAVMPIVTELTHQMAAEQEAAADLRKAERAQAREARIEKLAASDNPLDKMEAARLRKGSLW